MKRQRKVLFIENKQETGFSDAEEAWFWCCRCRSCDADKFCANNNQEAKICETNDIYIILKRLYLNHLLGNRHLKTLVRFGLAQFPPSLKGGANSYQCRLWDEAITLLGKELQAKGIIVC